MMDLNNISAKQESRESPEGKYSEAQSLGQAEGSLVVVEKPLFRHYSPSPFPQQFGKCLIISLRVEPESLKEVLSCRRRESWHSGANTPPLPPQTPAAPSSVLPSSAAVTPTPAELPTPFTTDRCSTCLCSLKTEDMEGKPNSSILAETEAGSPATTLEQTNIWTPLDNFKISYLNQLGHRLYQLLQEGTLKLSSDAIIWIDENGLPTRIGISPLSYEDLERPRPFFFAGTNADISAFEDEVGAGRTLWRQPASEKENGLGEAATASPSSLFDLVFAELKSMPQITHLVWKNLLDLFETLSKSGRPYSDQMTADSVKGAMIREKKDFRNLELWENAFTDMDLMRGMILWLPCDSIHSLAGVDPKSPNRGAHLEILNDDLASNVSEIMRLATLLQQRKAPPDRLIKGAERLAKVASVLRAGEMGPLIGKHLTARRGFIDIELEPWLLQGRKRSLE